jgi:TetR/AcrR family transcriptional regulator, tetracycline repressor protein
VTRTHARREALRELPANTYPRTAATSDVVAAYNTTEQILWGFDRLLTGILAAPP